MRFGRVAFLVWCLLFAAGIATKVYPDQLPRWQGVYVEEQVAQAVGDHTLSFAGNHHFHLDIYDIPLQGQTEALSFGYRQEIGTSPFYWGIQTAAHFGALRGEEDWSFLRGYLGANVSFASQTVYTFGAELGYAFAPRWYAYLQGGVAAAQVSLAGSAHLFTWSVGDSLDGWAVGTFVAVGVKYDLGHNWAVGGAYEQFNFAGSTDLKAFGRNLGSFNAKLAESQVAVTLEYKF